MPIYCNWENAKEYEFTKNLSLHDWAWEFLRRNEEYSKTWDELFEKHIQSGGNPNETVLSVGLQLSGIKELNHKWRLSHFIDPKCDASYPMVFYEEKPLLVIRFSDEFERRIFNGYSLNSDPIEIPYGFAAVIFNLAKPIDAQVEIASKELKDYKKMHFKDDEIKRPPIGKWIEYLRILDAKNHDNNITNSKIARVLYPQDSKQSANKKVSDSYIKAKKLVDGEIRKYLDKSAIGEI